MKLTIVMSVYNGEKYIAEQLNSFLDQIRKPDEVLIFDDKSSDGTVAIINEFIEKYELPNWKLTINSENKGWKRNFIDGFCMATGDLIFPSDQDDIWLPQKLLECEKIMEDHKEIDVLTTNCIAFFEDGKEVIRPEPENNKIIKQNCKMDFFNTKYPGCTYCFRRKMMPSVMKYWEPDFPHDATIWRMGMLSGKLFSYNKALIHWRRHRASAYTMESVHSKTLNNKLHWNEYAIRCIDSMIQYANDIGADNQKQAVLKLNKEWLIYRTRFYQTKNIFVGLYILKYLKCYTRLRQYFGDWYLTFLGK